MDSTANFFISLVTSAGATGIIGWLFVAWQKTKDENVKSQINDLKMKNEKLEAKMEDFISKDDHYHIRKEDTGRVEKELTELKTDIKSMPQKIVDLLKPFLK